MRLFSSDGLPFVRSIPTFLSKQLISRRFISSMSEIPREGVLAIHKPNGITSAQVIRDAQTQFDKSEFFKPWLEQERARLAAESHNQKQKRKSWKSRQPLKVKIGHGGTLDPMATGVLVLGIGSGTKSLNQFLECTKTYETVVLFGAAADTYDSTGKVTARKPYAHITRQKVEGALQQFRGTIMQRPPIFSAIRIQGKRLYEYAREGKELPREIAERPVTVEDLEMTEWMEGGTHSWHWPLEEASKEDKTAARQALHIDASSDNGDDSESGHTAKRQKVDDSASASDVAQDPAAVESHRTTSTPPDSTRQETSGAPCLAPACRVRMTVTSGFYVRSFCHDLGIALGSLGLMTTLVRSRQADFKLGENVLEYEDLEAGEVVWKPKVQNMLSQWQEKGLMPPATKQSRPPKPINPPVSKERRNSSSGEE